MRDLITQQLDRSLATLTRVRGEEAIHATLLAAAKTIAESMKNGGKLLVAGNGGSAADAQHLVAEFVSRLNVNRPALPAIALTTDTSILTAIGNDFSYDYVFERQIEAIGNAGDVFLGISTSGNAQNLVRAMHICKQKNVRTFALLGNRGGAVAPLVDYAVIVPSNFTMHIQESHLALEHILCLLVERFYFGEDFENLPKYLAE